MSLTIGGDMIEPQGMDEQPLLSSFDPVPLAASAGAGSPFAPSGLLPDGLPPVHDDSRAASVASVGDLRDHDLAFDYHGGGDQPQQRQQRSDSPQSQHSLG